MASCFITLVKAQQASRQAWEASAFQMASKHTAEGGNRTEEELGLWNATSPLLMDTDAPAGAPGPSSSCSRGSSGTCSPCVTRTLLWGQDMQVGKDRSLHFHGV